MKFLVATALVATAAANMSDMLPFLMMDSFGNTYYTDGQGNIFQNPAAMMALSDSKIFKKNSAMLPLMMSGGMDSNLAPMMMMGGNKIFKKNNAMLPLMMSGGMDSFSSNPMAMMALTGNKMKGNDMLPFLMMDSFGNTYYTTGPATSPVLSNPLVTAQLAGDKFKAGRALSDEQLLLMSGGLEGGLTDNPWALTTLGSNKRYDLGTAMALGADIPFMAAAGNLKNFDYSAKDMALPFVVNQMGGSSLRNDVIPAMAMMGEKINMENILPWMLTSGQRYLGGEFGQVLPFLGGNTFKKAFKSDNLMPWLISDLGGSATYYAPAAPAYRPPIRAPIRATAPIGAIAP